MVTLLDRITNVGGGERMAVAIAKRLDRDRFESTLCVSRWSEGERSLATPAKILRELEETDTDFIGLERSSKAALWAWTPLVRRLRASRVDVIHGHMFGSNVWAALIGRLAGVPVVIGHEHVWSFDRQPVRRLLDREVIARGADAFLAVSEDTRKKMIEVEGIDPQKVTYVPNGIAVQPEGDGARVRAELGIPDDAPVVGSVGLLRAQKALDVLIRAVARLAPAHPGLRLLIAGDGEEQAALERLISELGVADTVTLLGFRTDVPDLLAAFDIAVSSSQFEGSPLAVMEFMEAAKPIVATSVGGVPELITDGETGRIVPPGEPERLADAIGDLLNDPEHGRELGRRARERRRREFSLDTTVKILEEMYVSLRLAKAPAVEGSSRPAAAAGVRRRGRPRTSDRLVLCYHALSHDWDSELAVTPARFGAQMRKLRDLGYRSVPFSEINEEHTERVVAITFDDAYRSVHRFAPQILAELDMAGTVFAVTEHVGTGRPMSWSGISQWLPSHPDELVAMDWDELRELRDLGWEVGSHTRTHPHLPALDAGTLAHELSSSRSDVAERLGECRVLAYPYGDHDERVCAAAEAAGYSLAGDLSSRIGPQAPMAWPRVGIYRADDMRRFALKVSRFVRMGRRRLSPGAARAIIARRPPS